MTRHSQKKPRAFDKTRKVAEKTIEGGKKHAVSIGISAVITGLASTFVPMIEQHWADEGVQAQIAEQKADRIREEGSLWHEIHVLQNQASGKTTNYLTDPIYASQ